MPQITQQTFQWTNVWNQYLGTFAANLIMLSQGCIFGWAAPALGRLTSDSTFLHSGALSSEQISWIGSSNCIGAVIGSLSFGYLTTFMGCKRAVLSTAIPAIFYWLLITFGNSYYYILAARVVGGWASGVMTSSIILYVSEIANDSIRGGLGSVSHFFKHIGVFIAYLLGAFIDYDNISYICITIPIIFAIIFSILPNTPQYYLCKGEHKSAEDAIKYYKGYRGLCDEEHCALFKECERIKLIADARKAEEKCQISDLFTSSALKGLGISFALYVFSHFSANFTIISYAVIIFQNAGTTLDPFLSSIILAIALIFGSLSTTYFADRLGRKVLNIVSLTGSAIGLLATSIYHYLYLHEYVLSEYEWMPVVNLSFVVFISSAGIVPLATVCSVENLMPKIRTVGMTIIAVSASIVAFIFVKVFPILLDVLSLYGCLLVYGIGSIVGVIFVYFFLEDTNGKRLDDVTFNENFARKINYNTFNTHAERINGI